MTRLLTWHGPIMTSIIIQKLEIVFENYGWFFSGLSRVYRWTYLVTAWTRCCARIWGTLGGRVLIISLAPRIAALTFTIACLNLGGIDMPQYGTFLLLVPGEGGTSPSSHWIISSGHTMQITQTQGGESNDLNHFPKVNLDLNWSELKIVIF